MPRVLLLFLDGVGLGPDDPDVNPFLQAQLPTFSRLFGGTPPTLGLLSSPDAGPGTGRLLALDACLGVEGLPQSGTGQIALLTGHNAPRLFGRHFGPWPPVRLRPLLARHNLLSVAAERGQTVAFANAYPLGYPEGRDPRRVAAPPLAARAAGALTRHHDALARGEAVASEIVNEGWRRHLGFRDLPRIGPAEAGENLARIAAGARLTLYAHYRTDTAGHRGGMSGAVQALERVDAFLSGLLGALPDDMLLVLASDHGNMEDVRGGHTRNPALGMVLGANADRFVESLLASGEEGPLVPLTRLAPAILAILEG